ncbi:MAG: hypothetical protein QCI82_05240 [Candidatus Thermoplasmatota archaeon]|nr:hypothetical protein [Candidatus Thermoplasmatota archaeon]
MRRILTLDLIRGSSIIFMIGAHMFRDLYDSSWVGTELAHSKSLLEVMFLFFMTYLGGFAGLFIMVSITSHTLSIQGQLGKGAELRSVMVRQLVGGFILLAFAFLVESTIGQYGFLGRMAYFDPAGPLTFGEAVGSNLSRIYYRGFHFMTLHVIAWSIILNTIIQWILYRNGGVHRIRRNVIIYGVLIIVTLMLTPLMWELAGTLVPGYPFATYPGSFRRVQYPMEGVTTPFQMVLLFFMGPLAGQTEPLFPFFIFSLIGAIIGIYLGMDRPPRAFCAKGLMIGSILIVTGIIGTFLFWRLGSDTWSDLMENTFIIMKMNGWLCLIMLVCGGMLILFFGALRLIEYRGVSYEIANRFSFVRRFAAASLTVYTFQYLDAIPRLLLSRLPWITVGSKGTGLFTTLFAILLVVVLWDLVLRVWAKMGFAGSVEWSLTLIQGMFARKDTRKVTGRRWYEVPKLDLLKKDPGIEWIQYIENERGSERNVIKESTLARDLSLLGIIFFPISFLALCISLPLMKKGHRNGSLVFSIALSKIGIALGAVELIILSYIDNPIVT